MNRTRGASAARCREKGSSAKTRWERAAAIAAVLLVWQLGAMAIGRTGAGILVAAPLTVIKRLAVLVTERDFLASVGFSLGRIALGFLLGLVGGGLLAAAAAHWHAVEVLLRPLITVIKSVPVASFIIIVLIWFGARSLSVIISLLMVLPIVYTNVLEGIRSADPALLEMAEVFRLGPMRRLRFIRLPALRPYLTSACSAGVGLAWKSGVAAEVIGIPSGSVGEKLYEAKVYLSSGDLFAWTLVIVVLSVLLEKLVLALLKLAYGRITRP